MINENTTWVPTAAAPIINPEHSYSFGATHALAIGVLVGIVAFLLLVLICMATPSLSPSRGAVTTTPTNQSERIKRRYQTIQEWLITKKVVDDELQGDTGDAAKNTTSLDNDDDDHQMVCCQICLEEFQVGDRVSWSTSCNHVYHLSCIKEWLLKKKDCPYCRHIMLQVDEEGCQADKTSLVQLLKTKRTREACTYFCKQNGLVVVCEQKLRPTAEGSATRRQEDFVIEPPIKDSICPPQQQQAASQDTVTDAAAAQDMMNDRL